eukprot:2914712-Rhodomonas_salina.4
MLLPGEQLGSAADLCVIGIVLRTFYAMSGPDIGYNTIAYAIPGAERGYAATHSLRGVRY